MSYPFSQSIAWQPDEETIAATNLARFWKEQGFTSYEDLQTWALEDIGRFWDTVMKDLDIRFRKPYSAVMDISDGIERPRWCMDGEMNIVDNLLDKWLETAVENYDAIRYESEEGEVQVLSYRELHDLVAECSAGLQTIGLQKGDAVGLMMPMTPELIIALLAVVRMGGIIVPLFSGYGVQAVATRLADADAKALFVSNGAMRRGKVVDLKAIADEALSECPSVEHVIVHQRISGDALPYEAKEVAWEEVLALGRNAAPELRETVATSAEDPMMLIYTSGTTGRPKGAIHTHCSFPIKAAQDIRHPMDLKAGEVMWWMTDMGWMMGPWLVFGTLLNGATMVLFDGAPDFPDVDRVWQICTDHKVTHLGVSPTLIRSLRPNGIDPIKKHDLSALRAAGSTGSPWDPESWMWLFENVLESRKPILNYSGGTEISGGIVCGSFLTPLKPGAFSGPVLGMDVDVVNDYGDSVREEVGELIIRQPWIGMTRGFWKDADGERYLDAYWNRFPGVWTHGDFAGIDSDDLWYILGRSDDTIKVAGKRLGPAEVESVLNAHPHVIESAAIGVPHEIKGQEVVAFCVLKSGIEPSDDLRKELSSAIVTAMGKPLAPKEILFAEALPKTRNAKVMRRMIRSVFLDQPIGDSSSLENPATLDAIKQAV